MRAFADGRLRTESAVAEHVGRCLGCRACESVCPSGVPYGSLLETARADLAEHRPVARAAARVALGLLTEGRRAGAVYGLLRALRATGVAGLAGRILPGRAGLAARLLAASRPRSQALAAPAGGSGPAPAATPRPTFALLEGCVMAGLFGHVHAASRSVLAKCGMREIRAAGQVCCGALHAHAGERDAACRLARRNIEAFEAADAEWIVADAAGCGAALREYGTWLADDPEWGPRAAALSPRVRDVMELAADPGGRSADSETLAPFPAAPASRLRNLEVGYDAPCHLLHAQGVDRAPLAALRRFGYARARQLPSGTECCGGAGVYNLFHPELAARILAPKLDEIRREGYDVVTTGNPGCAMQIGEGLRRVGLRIPVVHPVELLELAMGRGRSRPGREGDGWKTEAG